jgi:hypothetical protein
MPMIVVYRFRFFDKAKGKLVEAEDMATDKAIRQLDGVRIPGSEKSVEASRVSRLGLLTRPRADNPA